jgi:hypothetical protein
MTVILTEVLWGQVPTRGNNSMRTIRHIGNLRDSGLILIGTVMAQRSTVPPRCCVGVQPIVTATSCDSQLPGILRDVGFAGG